MKTKVNTHWFNQTVKHLKNGIAQEKIDNIIEQIKDVRVNGAMYI